MTQPSGTATFTSHSATTKIVMELDIVFIPVAAEDGRGGNGANGHCLEKSFESVWGEKITEIWASFFLRTSFWNASFCMEWLKLPKYDRTIQVIEQFATPNGWARILPSKSQTSHHVQSFKILRNRLRNIAKKCFFICLFSSTLNE